MMCTKTKERSSSDWEHTHKRTRQTV